MRGCHLRHPRVVLEDARDQVLRAAVHPLEQQRGVCVQQLRLHEDVVVRLVDGEERGASGARVEERGGRDGARGGGGAIGSEGGAKGRASPQRRRRKARRTANGAGDVEERGAAKALRRLGQQAAHCSATRPQEDWRI